MNELPSINKRLKEIIDYHTNGNIRSFCRKIGLNESTKINRLFKIDSRTGKFPTPSTDIIKNVCNMLHVNETWLLTGEGEMLKQAPLNKGVEEPVEMYGSYKEEVFRLRKECNDKGNRIIELMEELERLRNEINNHKI